MTWETILKREMVDFDVTDGICCSRAKTDILRYWVEVYSNIPKSPVVPKIKQFVETSDCKVIKNWAEKMLDNPHVEDKTFWPRLLENWKECEGGSF